MRAGTEYMPIAGEADQRDRERRGRRQVEQPVRLCVQDFRGAPLTLLDGQIGAGHVDIRDARAPILHNLLHGLVVTQDEAGS